MPPVRTRKTDFVATLNADDDGVWISLKHSTSKKTLLAKVFDRHAPPTSPIARDLWTKLYAELYESPDVPVSLDGYRASSLTEKMELVLKENRRLARENADLVERIAAIDR